MARRKVWIETYGCQMNKAESEALLLDLAAEGWEEGESADSADLVVINTCSVRKTAEDRILGRLGHYRRIKKNNKNLTLALIGCMAERQAIALAEEFPEIDVIAGTFRKHELARAVRTSMESGERMILTGGDDYVFNSLHSTKGFKAFVPIMHGCNNFCSYCIVPVVRGREVSRDPGSILKEIRELEAKGIVEITLLGQNVNSYRYGGMSFASLLREVSAHISTVRWIRFLTSHPRDLSDDIIEIMSTDSRFCRHIHLPIQSGSDSVLAAMNRGYSSKAYEGLVSRIRAGLTGVSISTDILIGFPGETPGDFTDTIGLMERVGFDDAFMYYYNPREGTPAFSLPNPLPDEVKLERLARVIEAQKRISDARMRGRVGQEVEVLVEGVSKRNESELLARTQWDGMVVFPGTRGLIGTITRVMLEDRRGNTFRGRLP
jgi:tRNA-2-methylthio-N6-dimethylallyladenosine synthase